MFDADGEPEPEVYVAAAARNQAGFVFGTETGVPAQRAIEWLAASRRLA
jgi:hypothetical protein